MPYNIYLTSNDITPFLVVSDTTIDNSTSLGFVGRQKLGYGQTQDQNFLTLLENSANSTSPTSPLVGQLWYDEANAVLKVCSVNGVSPVWSLVGAPAISPPTSPGIGNLWFDVSNDVLYAWTGAEWLAIGPAAQLAPFSVYEQDYTSVTTTNNTTTLMWKNGINGSYLTLASNTTYLFEIQVSARRTDSGQDYAGWIIKGVINNTSGTLSMLSSPSIETIGMSSNASSWTVSTTIDQTNTSLDIYVTGGIGQTVNWTAVIEFTKCS